MGSSHTMLAEMMLAELTELPGRKMRPAELEPERPVRADPVRQAKQRLLALLPAREDSQVLCDFVEDDLREGLQAVGEVEAHFTDVLDMLRSGPLTPVAMLEVGEDLLVLRKLEQLHTIVSQLRRRLSQAAGKLRR